MNKKRILIVEDEQSISQILSFNIKQAGYEYETAFDGQEGLEKALTGTFDLILLDLMLPKMDGFEVCKRIREKLSTPIIMVTAREEEVDKVMGLDTGADDYVTKPFFIKELLSRIRANIRRSSSEFVAEKTETDTNSERIVVRELCIDCDKYKASVRGEDLSLTKKEYELLLYLIRNRGKICTREDIMSEVWGYNDFYGGVRAVDVTMRRLREKIEKDPANPEYLETKRGVGYYIQ